MTVHTKYAPKSTKGILYNKARKQTGKQSLRLSKEKDTVHDSRMDDLSDTDWTYAGKPAFFHASKPPITSVAFNSPMSCRAAAARLLARPSWSSTITRRSKRSAMLRRSSTFRGSKRNSRSERAMTSESGTSPCSCRRGRGRMSTRTTGRAKVSERSSERAWRGVSRSSRERAMARIWAEERAPCGGVFGLRTCEVYKMIEVVFSIYVHTCLYA